GITPDGQLWEPARGKFLVPIHALSYQIAQQFRAALKAMAPAVFAKIPPRVFHNVRYYGLWHPSKRDESNRAWMLLILATPADSAQPPKMASLSEAVSQLAELTDPALDGAADHDDAMPRCPHCGSCRTRFLGEYPRLGVT